MFKTQNSEHFELDLKGPNETRRSMKKRGSVQKIIEKYLNVSVTTPQTKRLPEKALLPQQYIKKLRLQIQTSLNSCERVQKLQNDQIPNSTKFLLHWLAKLQMPIENNQILPLKNGKIKKLSENALFCKTMSNGLCQTCN